MSQYTYYPKNQLRVDQRKITLLTQTKPGSDRDYVFPTNLTSNGFQFDEILLAVVSVAERIFSSVKLHLTKILGFIQLATECKIEYLLASKIHPGASQFSGITFYYNSRDLFSSPLIVGSKNIWHKHYIQRQVSLMKLHSYIQ